MTHRFVRDPSKLQEGASQQLQDQLALYKTPASIRELKEVNLIFTKVATRRPLLIRPNTSAPFITPNMASTDNKMYAYFPKPCIQEIPFGARYVYSPNPADYPPKQNGDEYQVTNQTMAKFPYQANCNNVQGIGSSHVNAGFNTWYPLQYKNPPNDGNANAAEAFEGTYQAAIAGVQNFTGKFYPASFSYDPPPPYPKTSEWGSVSYPNPFGYGGNDYYFPLPDNLDRQITQSAYSPIADLLGTEGIIDLSPYLSQLTDVKVASDKIVYEITLKAVQVSSDGRTLSSARLISNGAKKMDQYLKKKFEPEPDSDYTAFNEEMLFTTAGFGFPTMFIPRPIVAEPIEVSIEEFSSPNNPVNFIANSNEGYSLDKSSGSIMGFGKFPFSQLKIRYGRYLREPIGDKDAPENETNHPGWYDLNNEYFSTNQYGGADDPVLHNQQILKLDLHFSIKIISLF